MHKLHRIGNDTNLSKKRITDETFFAYYYGSSGSSGSMVSASGPGLNSMITSLTQLVRDIPQLLQAALCHIFNGVDVRFAAGYDGKFILGESIVQHNTGRIAQIGRRMARTSIRYFSFEVLRYTGFCMDVSGLVQGGILI